MYCTLEGALRVSTGFAAIVGFGRDSALAHPCGLPVDRRGSAGTGGDLVLIPGDQGGDIPRGSAGILIANPFRFGDHPKNAFCPPANRAEP